MQLRHQRCGSPSVPATKSARQFRSKCFRRIADQQSLCLCIATATACAAPASWFPPTWAIVQRTARMPQDDSSEAHWPFKNASCETKVPGPSRLLIVARSTTKYEKRPLSTCIRNEGIIATDVGEMPAPNLQLANIFRRTTPSTGCYFVRPRSISSTSASAPYTFRSASRIALECTLTARACSSV